MNFFEQLHAINPDADLTFRVMGKNGKFTVSVTPTVKESKIAPVVITGTPEELDNGFVEMIKAPMKEAGLVINNLSEYQKSLKDAEKDGKEVSEKKTTPAAKKATPLKKAASVKKSPASKTSKAKKSATPKPDRHEPDEIQEEGGGEVETQGSTEPKQGEASLF